MPQHYCDRAGNAVTADQALDAAGNLRNGFGMRIPLQMCDSMQRSVAEDGRRGLRFEPDQRMQAAQNVVDQLEGRDEMLRRMYRDGRAEADKARAEMIRDMASGREAGPPGAYPYSAAAEGTKCTINGEDGTLVMQGDWLVCKPRRQNAQPSHDSSADPRTVAYAEMLRDTDYRTRGNRHG